MPKKNDGVLKWAVHPYVPKKGYKILTSTFDPCRLPKKMIDSWGFFRIGRLIVHLSECWPANSEGWLIWYYIYIYIIFIDLNTCINHVYFRIVKPDNSAFPVQSPTSPNPFGASPVKHLRCRGPHGQFGDLWKPHLALQQTHVQQEDPAKGEMYSQ